MQQAVSCYLHSLHWRHNEPDSVSNHQPHDCLLNCLFRRRSKKTSKLRVTGLCAGNSPLTSEFPAQMASNAENVSIWWRHHDWFWPRSMSPLPFVTCPKTYHCSQENTLQNVIGKHLIILLDCPCVDASEIISGSHCIDLQIISTISVPIRWFCENKTVYPHGHVFSLCHLIAVNELLIDLN